MNKVSYNGYTATKAGSTQPKHWPVEEFMLAANMHQSLSSTELPPSKPIHLVYYLLC